MSLEPAAFGVKSKMKFPFADGIRKPSIRKKFAPVLSGLPGANVVGEAARVVTEPDSVYVVSDKFVWSTAVPDVSAGYCKRNRIEYVVAAQEYDPMIW